MKSCNEKVTTNGELAFGVLKQVVAGSKVEDVSVALKLAMKLRSEGIRASDQSKKFLVVFQHG